MENIAVKNNLNNWNLGFCYFAFILQRDIFIFFDAVFHADNLETKIAPEVPLAKYIISDLKSQTQLPNLI